MELTIILLLIASVLILIYSFLKKDPVKDVEKQLENFSISLMQEILKLKNKVTVMEEELMLPDSQSNKMESKKG
ncbi:hypothetical protein [Pueribacillus sp. YX66]|uniref:hypothetical protein n=1 Tax=Pueribacillus sp. YX66 TaxID=3229242 RepID=UPI00358D1B42